MERGGGVQYTEGFIISGREADTQFHYASSCRDRLPFVRMLLMHSSVSVGSCKDAASYLSGALK